MGLFFGYVKAKRLGRLYGSLFSALLCPEATESHSYSGYDEEELICLGSSLLGFGELSINPL